MTPKQTAWYWREWQAVHAVHPAADRHALHVAALGADKSSKSFTNADLDKVIAQFRALSDPAGLNAQVRQIEQPRRRLLYSIQEYARACVTDAVPAGESPGWHAPPPDAAFRYLSAVARAKFGTDALHNLTDPQLVMLQHTLAARAAAKRRAQKAPHVALDPSHAPF